MSSYLVTMFIIQCVGIVLGVLRLTYPELNVKSTNGSIAFGIAVGTGFALWAGLIIMGVIV